MSSPDAEQNPPAHPQGTPVPPEALDATIAMERPADLSGPAMLNNATIAMERPKNHFAPNPNLEVTIEIPRTPIPGVRSPALTLEMERPAGLNSQARTSGDSGVTLQPERRAAGRESGTFQVEIPKPLPAHAKKLGEVLIQMGKLSPEQVEEALQWARESGDRLGRCLIRWGVVAPDVICRALSIQTGLPMTMLEEGSIPEALSRVFPLGMMMHHSFVPFDQSPSVLCVAASNPLEPELIKELEKSSKKVIEVFLAREDNVDRQLDWLRIKLKTRSRRNLRYAMKIPAAYQLCSRQGARIDKSIHVCKTENVSEGGFLLDSPAPAVSDPAEAMRKGLYINLCLKWEEQEIWAICEVRELRLQTSDHDNSSLQQRWLMGVEIIDINPDFKKKLKDLCKKASGKK